MSETTWNKRPTIKDVARLSGLSIASVSRYINQAGPVSSQGASRIQAAIDELQFRPYPAAQALVRSATRTVGLLIPAVSGAFFTPMLRGIEKRLVQAGYALLIHATHPRASEARPGVLAEHNTDGLVVFADSLDERELARLDAQGFPLVLLFNTGPARLQIPSVVVDNAGGVLALLHHLVAVHGCRRIAHLHGPVEHEDARQRLRAYRLALQSYGLDFDPSLEEPGGFDAGTAHTSVRKLLSTGVLVDAIFAADDESAAGALRALGEASLRVPEQVKVVGFDDLHLAAHLHPGLTTVHSPIESAAYTATDLLLRRINGESVPTSTILQTELVVRRSCGCPAVELTLPAQEDEA